MRILGICHDVLICSACVLVDGEIVAAIPRSGWTGSSGAACSRRGRSRSAFG